MDSLNIGSNTSTQYYRWNRNTGQFDQKSIIDYIITSDKRFITNVKVLPGISFDSDHRLVVGDMKIKKDRVPIKQKWKIIKTEPLKNPETKVEYVTRITEKLEELEEEPNWNDIKDTIITVAEDKLGTKWVGGTKRKHSPWWSEELRNAVKDKTKKHRIWMKQRDAQTRQEYVDARNKVNKEKIAAKKKWWQERGKEIEDDIMQDKKKLYGLAKAYRKPKTGITSIKNKEGEVQITPEEINSTWTEYFTELLNVLLDEEER